MASNKSYYEKVPLKSLISYGSNILPIKFKINENTELIELDNIVSGENKTIKNITIGQKLFNLKSRKTFGKNMILYSKLRPYLDKIILTDSNGICSSELVPIISFVNPSYLILVMRSPKFISKAVDNSYGTKMPRTNLEKLFNFQVPIFTERTIKKMLNKYSLLVHLLF